jgi:hypothetical protein
VIEFVVVAAVALFLVTSAVAPLEALGWWAGWRGGGRSDEEPSPEEASDATHFVVYLSGISALAGDVMAGEEVRFLERLQARLPRSQVVRDVFPYSVTNTGLNGQRALAWFWTRLERVRMRRRGALVGLLINLRNSFQVAVSADQRYGPIYNFGVADEILGALRQAGYRAGSGVPVTLLGWSGGAQIALGAAPFLARVLDARISLISIGGVMAADPGLDRIHHLWHLIGSRDRVQLLGFLASPGRWPMAVGSPWHRAFMEGRITEIPMGPVDHRYPGNYFDETTALPGGQDHATHTLVTVLRVLEGDGVEVGEEPGGVTGRPSS